MSPTLSANKASGNNVNGIASAGSADTSTLAAGAGVPDVINKVSVLEGATLTFQAGTIVKMMGSLDVYGLDVYGALVMQGNASNPVIFTSLKDDSVGGDTNNDGNASAPAPGDWGLIMLESADSSALIQYATIRYGTGYPNYSYNGMLYVQDGSLTIQNSTIAASETAGIDISNGPSRSPTAPSAVTKTHGLCVGGSTSIQYSS